MSHSRVEHDLSTTLDAIEPRERPSFTLKGLWTDSLGRTGIRAAQVLLIGIVAVVFIWALLRLTVILIPTLIALIVACALWPLVRHCRKIMGNMLAAWTVFLGSLLILGGIGTALVFSVINEWPTLVDQAVEGFEQIRDWAVELMAAFNIQIGQTEIEGAVDSVVTFLTSAQFGAGAVSTISAAGTFVTGLVLFMVTLFFFLKDGDRIWAFFISWTPIHNRKKWILSGERAQSTFGGYIRGTAIVAAVDAIGITIALLILQVPLALPLGVIVFLGAFIPMVGATVAGILATLVALVANGPVVALIVLAAVILVNQLEGNFLQPIVMSQTLNLHALIILMALTGGTVLAGLIGAILAVPLVAVIWSVIKVWTGRDEEHHIVDDAAEHVEAVTVSERMRRKKKGQETLTDDTDVSAQTNDQDGVSEVLDSDKSVTAQSDD